MVHRKRIRKKEDAPVKEVKMAAVGKEGGR